ncbi:hypothetical protein HMN09_00002600 [Mycena chlorophos]|uniref:Uncharacterized protein n=1 Tax=Mycena chlorophos TaxID=658473 RepID=A0A8H6WRV4_MYCCL|nr:hypothetical protein HMN09_00002600 [Mycena chlorophos]
MPCVVGDGTDLGASSCRTYSDPTTRGMHHICRTTASCSVGGYGVLSDGSLLTAMTTLSPSPSDSSSARKRRPTEPSTSSSVPKKRRKAAASAVLTSDDDDGENMSRFPKHSAQAALASDLPSTSSAQEQDDRSTQAVLPQRNLEEDETIFAVQASAAQNILHWPTISASEIERPLGEVLSYTSRPPAMNVQYLDLKVSTGGAGGAGGSAQDQGGAGGTGLGGMVHMPMHIHHANMNTRPLKVHPMYKPLNNFWLVGEKITLCL